MNRMRTKGPYIWDSFVTLARFGFPSADSDGMERDVRGSNSKNSLAGIGPMTEPTISFPSAMRDSSLVASSVIQGLAVDSLKVVGVGSRAVGISKRVFSWAVGSGRPVDPVADNKGALVHEAWRWSAIKCRYPNRGNINHLIIWQKIIIGMLRLRQYWGLRPESSFLIYFANSKFGGKNFRILGPAGSFNLMALFPF